MNERETAQHFYEMLTGVFDDEQSKIFRYICFGVLLLGMIWAGWYYFRAHRLSDTNTPIDPDMYVDVQPRSDNAPLKRIVDLAATIDAMRSSGSSIAAALDSLHNMPFNLNPEGGLERTQNPNEPSTLSSTPTNVPQRGPVNVKMIMTVENGDNIAVIDAIGEKGLIVRKGDALSGDNGVVSAITDRGITILFNESEDEIPLPEIRKYNKFFKTGRKSR
ncbi:MAG: hypothetical protein IJQ08_10650 [Synergistaceae bacterium]|nr:hypothetical protein [Synergistaceae bacterium]MBR0169120.1 hypothetical protein [Synergistaceae bacterium]